MINSPTENDYIDIHTHSKKVEKDVFRILNVFPEDFNKSSVNQPISIGLHPWHIKDQDIGNIGDVLRHSAQLPQVKAIGETGLDRVISTNFAIQEEIFNIHIKIAVELNKPLIIHCVKAYSEIIRIKNKFSSGISWIMHGFDGNVIIAEDLISKGLYISLGSRFLKNKLKTVKISDYIPADRIFIETDEDKTSIKDIYNQVAELYNTDVTHLKEIIRLNYLNVFKGE